MNFGPVSILYFLRSYGVLSIEDNLPVSKTLVSNFGQKYICYLVISFC